MSETKEIITLPHKADVPALFNKEGGIAELIERIEKEARSIAIDISTPTGRKEAKSLAAKVSRSKTLIDEVGKEQNDERNRLNKIVNEQRNMAKERLDALRDEIRQPVEEWEAKEADRVRQLEIRLDTFSKDRVSSHDSTEAINAVIAEIEATEIDESWQEREGDARLAKADALDKYRIDLGAAQTREDQEAELLKLRAEAEARQKADEERAAKEAAERAEKERQEREAQAKAEAEKQAQEAAERAAKEAEEKAARELQEAKEQHARELAEAKAARERAAEEERARIAAEEKAIAEEAAKRAADNELRDKVRAGIIQAIADLKPTSANDIADALIDGKIPNVKVEF